MIDRHGQSRVFRRHVLDAVRKESQPVSPRDLVQKLERQLSSMAGFRRVLLSDALTSLLASGEVQFTKGLKITGRPQAQPKATAKRQVVKRSNVKKAVRAKRRAK